MSERSHDTQFPGFADIAARRRTLTGALVRRRIELGLTQTEVAARMGTSQSSVARLESGAADARLSTWERYAGALDQRLEVQLRHDG